jgi:lysyl-tRNA synthetase class 2
MYEFDPEWLAKSEALRAQGVEPWPNAAGLTVTLTSDVMREKFSSVEDLTTADGAQDVSVGGRVMFRNRMGRAMFLRLLDHGSDGSAGEKDGILQVYVRQEEVGEERFELLKKVDIGDFLWARGFLMRTKTGELTVQARETRLAAKVMSPFPDRWHSVTDVELRSRQRYVDLFMNADSREVFRRRSKIVRYIRDYLEERGFLEVETPMMHTIPGGANARPFKTHHNALDMELFLRIAPELYLKRLLVGGLGKVFEINRNFRNEGVSVKHNPEFTMLELYQAWATYEDLIELSEELLSGLAQAITGSTKVPFAGKELDFSRPFRRAPMDVLIAEYTGIPLADLEEPAKMEAFWRSKHRVGPKDRLPPHRGGWWDLLFSEYVEPNLVNPTFVTGFPTEISPLARRSDADPTRVDRFELYANGWELANAFSELNDPVDQAGRFEAQATAREAGDDEGMFFDADYIRALSYGMPPAAGQGFGIDRLVMLLTDRASIREVILFPTLRREAPAEKPENEG